MQEPTLCARRRNAEHNAFYHVTSHSNSTFQCSIITPFTIITQIVHSNAASSRCVEDLALNRVFFATQATKRTDSPPSPSTPLNTRLSPNTLIYRMGSGQHAQKNTLYYVTFYSNSSCGIVCNPCFAAYTTQYNAPESPFYIPTIDSCSLRRAYTI